MESITLKNYRCFREEQTVPMAPLTLLVGENSTGKTSFLAMVRALMELAYEFRTPDFKEYPYDLGSFDEIAHHRGARGSRADTFEAGFSARSTLNRNLDYNFEFALGKGGTAPVPIKRRIARGETSISASFASGEPYVVQVGTGRGTWKMKNPEELDSPFLFGEGRVIDPWFFLLMGYSDSYEEALDNFQPLPGSPDISSQDFKQLRRLTIPQVGISQRRPFASAPVRSKPHRTYDPARPTRDPEGDYVPMYLADIFSRDKDAWKVLRGRLEHFGKASGLFDEIVIRKLGEKGSDPFQVQIRKSGGKRKGPWRNLIDVGYGVSQALPVITELLRPDALNTFLIQQPEVHLHPSAQAALGSLFCQVASSKRQLIVETHSEFLINRVSMDVRDGVTNLKPSDVSILYFERGDLDVQIHPIRIDKEGNVINAPHGYGKFFMDEITRSLWKQEEVVPS